MNIVCLDNGHGIEVQGKSSPDGRFKEYAYTRKMAKALKEELEKIGIQVYMITPEENDIPINTRVKRVNSYGSKYDNKICISLHNNAAGNGSKWMNARGFSTHIAKNASSNSKKLANCIFDVAKELNIKVRQYSQSQKYWVQDLGICRDTKCPAVLTESLFQDNKEDVAYLESEEGFKTIIKLHVEGIKRYFEWKY